MSNQLWLTDAIPEKHNLPSHSLSALSPLVGLGRHKTNPRLFCIFMFLSFPSMCIIIVNPSPHCRSKAASFTDREPFVQVKLLLRSYDDHTGTNAQMMHGEMSFMKTENDFCAR
jgi:hypothetical protein